jgi:hypothetical protein
MARPSNHDGVVYRRNDSKVWWMRYRDIRLPPLGINSHRGLAGCFSEFAVFQKGLALFMVGPRSPAAASGHRIRTYRQALVKPVSTQQLPSFAP